MKRGRTSQSFRPRLPAMTSELKIGTRGPDEYLAEQGSVRVVHADSVADA